MRLSSCPLFSVVLLLALSALLPACTSAATPVATNVLPVVPTSAPVPLKIAVLPIIDALPMYVAEQEGLFAKRGLQVEFVPVAAAPERDQLIAAGQADGMINETLSTFFFNKDQPQVQIVRYALVPTAGQGHFFILASGKSGITKPEGLKGVEIGVSQGTVIEYVTDRLLEAEGLGPDEIKTIAVPKMADRMSLLASGGLKAGVLPDPLAALAVQQGAVPVLDDSKHPEYGFSVISFRKAVIDAHPEAIRAFLAATEEATKLVNANPEKYINLLSDKKLVPQPLLQTYKVPPFPAAGVPTEAEWKDALAWATSKGLINTDVSYTGSVNSSFLPEP
jgi:NitT/TauT family transport system substrate-binding protein